MINDQDFPDSLVVPQGESYTLSIIATVNDVPFDCTNCTAYFQVKQFYSDTTPLIAKVTANASLALATKTTDWNTVVECPAPGSAGNAVTVAAVADAGSKAGSITDVAGVVTFHFKDGVSQVSDMEALLPVVDLAVETPGTQVNVLHSTIDEFTATHLVGGSQAQAQVVTPQTGENIGALNFFLLPADTEALDPTLTYQCEARIVTPSGQQHVVYKLRDFVPTPRLIDI